MGYKNAPRKRTRSYRTRVSDPASFQISSILGSSFATLGLKAKLREYGVKKAWAACVGENISKRTSPERLIGQTLFCNVLNSTWMAELSYHKKSILDKLNAALGDGAVTEVVFKIGPVSPLKKRLANRTYEKRELTPDENSFIEETAAVVKDKKLKELIKRVMKKSKAEPY